IDSLLTRRVYSILAEVKDTSEFMHLADKFVFEGLITENQKSTLLNEVDEVLKSNEIAELFSKDFQTKAEKEIILPSGEVLRPDRVLIRDNEAIVIDFKSGQPHKKHETQVTQYADILRKMGYQPVSSKLVYLNSRSVVTV
ncbi:MAG: Dna2/Cas4 domain-containing protein, partial [Bacteroidota bacterium]